MNSWGNVLTTWHYDKRNLQLTLYTSSPSFNQLNITETFTIKFWILQHEMVPDFDVVRRCRHRCHLFRVWVWVVYCSWAGVRIMTRFITGLTILFQIRLGYGLNAGSGVEWILVTICTLATMPLSGSWPNTSIIYLPSASRMPQLQWCCYRSCWYSAEFP